MANHDLFVKSDGSLWGMGDNSENDLGDGTPNIVPRPEQIVYSNVTAVAVGEYHSLFIKSDGSLWGMGDNEQDQLGIGSWLNATPEEIVSSHVTSIAAGANWSLFIKSDGSLWAMGDNYLGQLGDGTITSEPPYTADQIEEIVTNGVTSVAAGAGHSLFLKSDGSLWAMGWQQFGQLGDGSNGEAPYYATNQPEEIVSSNVTAIAAGEYHSLFLKTDGSLWGMGNDAFGQLGIINGSTNQPEEIVSSNVTAIAAGQYHSLFLKTDGSLWGMGYNDYGQLGDGTFNLEVYQPEEIVSSNVTAIAAGQSHSLFLKTDGSLWVMGNGGEGQLGDGFTSYNVNQPSVPEQIVPSPQPLLFETIASNTNLQFAATCPLAGNYYLLMGTNLSQPLGQWTPVWTNTISHRSSNNFAATITNGVGAGSQQFFILQSK